MQEIAVKRIGQLIFIDPVHSGFIDQITEGVTYNCKLTKPRNPKFHKKFFALISCGFSHFDPLPYGFDGKKVTKSFDRFRKDVIIEAGYNEPIFRLDGSFTVEAKSISFANMEQIEFETLYNRCVQVLLNLVFDGTHSRADVDRIVEQLMGF